MQMAYSSLLSLIFLVLLFSISSAYTQKWSSPNGLNQNPIKMVSEDLLMLSGQEAEKDTKIGRSQTVIVCAFGATEHDHRGGHFNDGRFTGIREINLEYGNKTAIGSFQVTYDLNGKPYEGEKHASKKKNLTAKISLEFSTEYRVEVSGYAGVVGKGTMVRSLTFKTNKKTYRPYRVANGTEFYLPIESGLIVGFKEAIVYRLNYIGFYLSI